MARDDELRKYTAAAHAMQSGVAAEMNFNPSPTTPKHLRVGVNSALCDQAAIARLLIAKGIITDLEYVTAIREEMEREAERYKKIVNDHYGTDKIDLL
jgi:hypothetical protein